MSALDLSVMHGTLAVCRLPPTVPPPNWALAGNGFLALTRTAGELTVVVPSEAVPERVPREDGWRALRVDTPLDFSMTGVLASLAQPLADADVSIFAISTNDTDYVLVTEDTLERAIEALGAAGHRFAEPEAGTGAAVDEKAR
ncbi:MAG: ACT domain-containing protein [Thermoleophilaceae bacterium]